MGLSRSGLKGFLKIALEIVAASLFQHESRFTSLVFINLNKDLLKTLEVECCAYYAFFVVFVLFLQQIIDGFIKTKRI